MTQADILLGNDSGIGHLAGAMGKRTLVLFGLSNHIHYRPLGPSVAVLEPVAQSFTTPETMAQQSVLKAVLEML